ncbi:hypothetical protein HHI36_018703 [Cryptolaemus montrouzieri]|uniref:Uncharacterized protein n=1 Tax=Cryptolaemus montrouzieri TaxID=559131 RepID=A0ABD2P1L4_9CUCU
MVSKTFVFCIALSFFFIGVQSDEFVNLLTNITSKDQLYFVQYHVTRGYFVLNNIPTDSFKQGFSEEYSEQMYQTFLTLSQPQNSSEAPSVYISDLSCMICTPEGHCFDPTDAGTHP